MAGIFFDIPIPHGLQEYLYQQKKILNVQSAEVMDK